ncbi:MAG: protein-glutamate O-methyltransferase CheR [candidate division NC10 bacterium]|nr:protein-glutamate O-methyltransferase CheR [candidate division NC10 bacterium]
MAPGTPRTAGIVGPGLQRKLEAEAFSGLRDLILRAGGIDLDLYKEKCVLRRITVRQRACGAPSLRAYLRLVSSDPAERSRLVKALTIHVSQFFRNPSTFQAIQEEILPTILTRKQRGGGRALRLWSVGCAHGEEPYSLAILLLETGARALRDYSCSIYATEARYPEASLVQVPARWRQRYFLPDGDRYLVVPEVRRLVFFKGHNILDPLPFGRIDLLVCRNVLIYMTEVLQERVLLALSEALNPGGFLVLGKVEGLAGAARDCFEPVDVAERIYRKPELRSTRAA